MKVLLYLLPALLLQGAFGAGHLRTTPATGLQFQSTPEEDSKRFEALEKRLKER
jgi:hypothetical protein